MLREPIKLTRQSNIREVEKFFIIASEGTVTERKYFNQLENAPCFNRAGKIAFMQIKHPSGEGNPLSLRSQIREIKRDVNYHSSDELWMIIDTDQWKDLLAKHGFTFESFIEACYEEDGTKVLVSNPCFEIWLILHLRKLSQLTDEQQKKLLLNKKIGDKSYAKRLLADMIPGEHGYSGVPVARVFMPNVYEALENARAIAIEKDSYPKSLGSYVYKIVERVVKEPSLKKD